MKYFLFDLKNIFHLFGINFPLVHWGEKMLIFRCDTSIYSFFFFVARAAEKISFIVIAKLVQPFLASVITRTAAEQTVFEHKCKSEANP